MSLGKEARQTIPRDNLWQIPTGLMPEKPFIVFRRLTEEQMEYLRTRRAAKKYEPSTAPHRVRR